jgi:hypothetical protein
MGELLGASPRIALIFVDVPSAETWGSNRKRSGEKERQAGGEGKIFALAEGGGKRGTV